MKNLVVALALIATTSRLMAYGPDGHELVGAIADELLAKRPAGKDVTALIDGITLRKAANIPDEIKSWDKKTPDDPNAFPHYSEHPQIDTQLREFWRANPPKPDPQSPIPSHHWFHYTDVPLVKPEKYSDGKVGRSQWDIVHMIPFCVSVLRGEIPADNPRKITRPVAVLLLAHYVGDIHQPLHVGAEYFTQAGEVDDPDRDPAALEDQGGNSLTFSENPSAQHPRHYYHSFHGYWDLDAVRNLLIGTTDELPKDQRAAVYTPAKAKILAELSSTEPKNWRTQGDPKTWAEQWADEILPIAREAHTRLRFEHVHREEKDGVVLAKGHAQEIDAGYREWATGVVREEIWKAGWRLADLLEKCSAPAKTSASTSTSTSASASTPLLTPTPLDKPATAVATTPTSQYGSYPENYKEIVTAWLKASGSNGAQIDWQTEPKPADLPGANGKHLYGYLVIFNTGAKTRSVLIRDGTVVNSAGR